MLSEVQSTALYLVVGTGKEHLCSQQDKRRCVVNTTLGIYLDSVPIPKPHSAALLIGWQSGGVGIGGQPPPGTTERHHHKLDCAIQPTHSRRARPMPAYKQQESSKNTVCQQYSMTQHAQHGTAWHSMHSMA